MQRFSKPILIVTICSVALTQSGCLMMASYAISDIHTPVRNVSSNPEDWGGYEIDKIYGLQADVFLADLPNYSKGPALAPGKEFDGFHMTPSHWGGPTTVAEYLKDPSKYPEMDGIVEKGAQIRCVKIKRTYSPIYKMYSYYVFGEIVDGERKGKLVEISELSRRYVKGDYRLSPDPRFLRMADE